MMARQRKPPPLDVKSQVLHEAGYRCGNPSCRTILTLDIHHLEEVGIGGSDRAENLLPLCPNCHALYHRQGAITRESLRAWKMLLLAINEAYDRRSIDILLALDKMGLIYVSGDGILACAPLIAGQLVSSTYNMYQNVCTYRILITDRGKAFVQAWKRGDQEAAIANLEQHELHD
jgi:hypothetical protein